MNGDNKKKSGNNNKKQDGKFQSKNIKHDPQSESARAKFGLENKATDGDRKAHG